MKFAFLGFFRRLGYNVQGQKTLWWVITTLTVIAMAISIGVIYYPCIFTTLEILESVSIFSAKENQVLMVPAFCPLQAAGDAIYQSFRIQFGCDFATDLIRKIETNYAVNRALKIPLSPYHSDLASPESANPLSQKSRHPRNVLSHTHHNGYLSYKDHCRTPRPARGQCVVLLLRHNRADTMCVAKHPAYLSASHV